MMILLIRTSLYGDIIMSKLFTAGELAKIAGVSSRTIRFYDEKGILKPCGYSDGEYRLYDEEAVLRLQQILMFKYVGFSLEEISRLMNPGEKIDVGSMLDKQKDLMSKKREQIDRIIYALDKAKESCIRKSFDLEHFSAIMQLITRNDMADKRYGFYERFSTRQEEWYQWRFDNLELQENMYILDVGGGYGTPWMRVWEQIPAGCTIVMLDKDSKGRDYLKNHIKEYGYRLAQGVTFTFWDADAELVIYEPEKYDRILANHFWGYIEDKIGLMKKLQSALKPEGKLFSTLPSTVNEKDVECIVEDFLKSLVKIGVNANKLSEQVYIEQCLKECFSSVNCNIFVNELWINDEEAVYEYLCDSDKELQRLLEKKKIEFLYHIKTRLITENVIKIRVDGPMYVCEK